MLPASDARMVRALMRACASARVAHAPGVRLCDVYAVWADVCECVYCPRVVVYLCTCVFVCATIVFVLLVAVQTARDMRTHRHKPTHTERICKRNKIICKAHKPNQIIAQITYASEHTDERHRKASCLPISAACLVVAIIPCVNAYSIYMCTLWLYEHRREVVCAMLQKSMFMRVRLCIKRCSCELCLTSGCGCLCERCMCVFEPGISLS